MFTKLFTCFDSDHKGHATVLGKVLICTVPTNNINSDCPTATSNRINHSTCVCSIITCSNTINDVVSTEHCTGISMSHCNDTSGL